MTMAQNMDNDRFVNCFMMKQMNSDQSFVFEFLSHILGLVWLN
jgi:hypothetical protein